MPENISPDSSGSNVPLPSVQPVDSGGGTSNPLPEPEDENEAWKRKVVESVFKQADLALKRSDDLNEAGENFLKKGTYVPPAFDTGEKKDQDPESIK
jgi:hypothetical protein